MLTLITQLTIWIVFNDRNPIAICQFDQFVASLQAERRATRVLEVRHDIDELRSDAKRGFQFIYDHPILIRTDRDVLRAIGIPSLQCTQISWRFHDDVVAAVDKQPSNKIQRLLGAGGYQNIVGRHLHSVTSRMPRDHLAQRRISFSRAVLQSLRTKMVKHIIACFTEFLDRKDFWRW